MLIDRITSELARLEYESHQAKVACEKAQETWSNIQERMERLKRTLASELRLKARDKAEREIHRAAVLKEAQEKANLEEAFRVAQFPAVPESCNVTNCPICEGD